jgi:phenylacetate-CoA ligase
MRVTPYNYLHGAVYRLKDSLKGTGIYSLLASLKKEQFMSEAEIQKLQSDRLTDLLLQAQKHSPYYGDLFSQKGINISPGFELHDLRMIPLLRREDLQANLDRILCDNAVSPVLNSSGGSTGNPVNFYQDGRYAAYAAAANLLFTEWMGIKSGDKTAVFWGADRDFRDQSLRVRAWMKFDRVRALNSFSMDRNEILSFLEILNGFRPRLIQGYAGSLYLTACIIEETKHIRFKPAAIRSSAEALFDYQRQEIEKTFAARVFDFYGSREVNNLAAECSAHEGLHLFSSGRIVEIVDDDGNPVPDGKLGQIAVTDLTNYSFPFIRYINGDMAVKRAGPCSCGRGYPLLEKIYGRTSDMIIIDGRYIHGEYFTHLFYNRPEVKQFQIVQEDARNLKISVVPRDGNIAIDDIVATIRNKVGHGITIEVQFVDQIAVTSSGKYRFTISKLADTREGS